MTITNLIKKMHFEGDSDSASYPITLDTDIGLINLNAACETLVAKITQICGNYPFDDQNHGNIAEGTVTLEEGVSKYTITDAFLDILEVKVKDNNGKYHLVTHVTQKEDSTIVETEEATIGLPTEYRMVGRTMFLRPAPTAGSVTLTAGLLFKYTRTSYTILATDVSTGTLVVGIASPFHSLIAKMAALPYCQNYKKDRVPRLVNDIAVETNDMLIFYGNRLKDRNRRMTVAYHDNK